MLPPLKPATPPRRPSKRPAGRFAALNEFTDFSMAGLTAAEVRVWVVLYRDTKPNGLARTGQSDIARRAGLKPRSVKYAVAGLSRKGLRNGSKRVRQRP
ncbi:MAG: helix-turn-helix domain-containing protein [Gemmataceae bacterium]|nr:helix-turn-helix domain-containing protein [Gemmataceae bacterium]